LLTLDVATYSLPSQTRLGQQSSHLVHLRRCNLLATQPDTPRLAVVASRPSQALQLTSYQAREASISVTINSGPISLRTSYVRSAISPEQMPSMYHAVHVRPAWNPWLAMSRLVPCQLWLYLKICVYRPWLSIRLHIVMRQRCWRLLISGMFRKCATVGGRGSKKTMRPRRVQVWGTLLTLRAGWPHRPEALRSMVRTGPAVKYPACRD
jgi:hypothetical protein